MGRIHVKYLLVGGGVASAACAEAIRRLDRTERVLLVAQEISRPYDRAPLSKAYLRRETTPGGPPDPSPTWLAEHDVTLMTGRRVAHLDMARACALLDSGDEVFCDRLLLATGTAPRPLDVPGGTLPNTFHLKTRADADRLHHAIELSRTAGHNRATVVGAGLLGVEISASLARIGMHVDLVQSHGTVWPKLAGEQTGRYLGRRLRAAGVTAHAGTRAARLEGDGAGAAGRPVGRHERGGGLRRRGDRLAVQPRDLAQHPGRRRERHPHRRPRPHERAHGLRGRRLRRDLRPAFRQAPPRQPLGHARATGRLCGTNMAGGVGGVSAAYDAVTEFTSEIAGLTVHVWGDGRFVDHRLVRGNALADDGDFAEIGIAADGRVCQVIAIGRDAEHDALRRLVESRRPTSDRTETLKDPARSLE